MNFALAAEVGADGIRPSRVEAWAAWSDSFLQLPQRPLPPQEDRIKFQSDAMKFVRDDNMLWGAVLPGLRVDEFQKQLILP